MAMQGDLQIMAIADLIQHNCQDRNTARLTIENDGQEAILYFKEGSVRHATLGELAGEEAVYEVLSWHDGHFTLEMSQEPPTVTIERSWSSLLFEGAQRLDEATQLTTHKLEEQSVNQENTIMAKRRSDVLTDALTGLLQDSSDISGIAIVGVDGLVYSANVPQKDMDEELVGATSAAILGLSVRSASQLKRGGFKQTLIQGDDGNIIVVSLNEETLLIGLTPGNVNLGMAFAEMRNMASQLNGVL